MQCKKLTFLVIYIDMKYSHILIERTFDECGIFHVGNGIKNNFWLLASFLAIVRPFYQRASECGVFQMSVSQLIGF